MKHEALLPLVEDLVISEITRERLAQSAPSRPGSQLLDDLRLSGLESGQS